MSGMCARVFGDPKMVVKSVGDKLKNLADWLGIALLHSQAGEGATFPAIEDLRVSGADSCSHGPIVADRYDKYVRAGLCAAHSG